MTWDTKPRSKYHIEYRVKGIKKASICWTDKKDHVLLFVGRQVISRFNNATEAMKHYDEIKDDK